MFDLRIIVEMGQKGNIGHAKNEPIKQQTKSTKAVKMLK